MQKKKTDSADYSYYRCITRVMINSHDKCSNKYVRADMLQMVIW